MGYGPYMITAYLMSDFLCIELLDETQNEKRRLASIIATRNTLWQIELLLCLMHCSKTCPGTRGSIMSANNSDQRRKSFNNWWKECLNRIGFGPGKGSGQPAFPKGETDNVAEEEDPDCIVDLAEPDNSEPAGKAEEEELDWAVDLTEPDNSEPAWKAQKRKFAKRKAQNRKTAKNKLEVEYDNRNVASGFATRLSRGESAIHMEEEASTVTPQTTENGSSPDFAVGNRVAVYWSDDDVYYEGVVTRKRKRDQIHIDYDDGESEWIYAKATKMKLLDGGLSGDREIKHDLANVKATLKVGSRVSVWWPAEKEYFDGTVGQIDRRKSKPHFLKYDDGDEEWIHLAHRKFIYGSRK